MEIVRNEFLLLEEENGFVFITVIKKGYPLLMINKLLSNLPRVNLNKFLLLKEAVDSATGEKVEVGVLKPEVECNLSKDLMTAKIRLYCTQEELDSNYDTYVSKILDLLHYHNVREGIKVEVLQGELEAGKEILIAEGVEPVNGEDAVVTYFKRSDRKPKIMEDGKANYYEMNFIDEVKKGDWLGERIPPKDGKPGKTVTGDFIHPKPGTNKKLFYDHKTIGEFEEDGKTVLRALIEGVVEFQAGKIVVGDHLVIDGDVGIETGNLDFIGSITVKGTVMDGFEVTATKDISILSELGISGINRLESKRGDIFIKGGIFGKGQSVVLAAKNIFLKHANECTLEAGENIHIGFYSLGSILKAKSIIADGSKGKLIGGIIEARSKVTAGIIGNRLERKTVIHVAGFNREKLKAELDEMLMEYKQKVMEVEKLKRKLEVFDSFMGKLNTSQHKQFEETRDIFDALMHRIFTLEEKRKSIMEMLETKGEGEVCIGQIAFPDTQLEIKHLKKKLNSGVKGTFYSENNIMHFE
ncbi:DUF342 domain-containing protein [Peribacillus saganii]|uniref:DUF342 domain-containing protein n=1 Tax=Peribacillus saganii TaxID=2303992 RepID=A0A372LPD0_9BACI|nr:FapA family protein [Peribacillus saganii]RFU69804.1 DUF342 domain-containing protein [Peribacillus saganii]